MKPILCDSTKNLTEILNDSSNGLGRLDVTRAIVIEERNGIYELEFDIATSDEHFNDLSIGGIVKCTGFQGSGLQMFRIYAIEKPINEICTVFAQHITYDLNKIAIKPFNATGIQNACRGLKNNMMGDYPFTISSDIDNTSSRFVLAEPHTMRECLGGMEGSLLDVFSSRGSGEYLWDNLNIEFNAHRGVDNGVKIAYGKNLTDFKQEESIENVYDAVVGFATINDITTTGDVQNITGATYPRTMIVDFSQEFDDDNPVTKAKLNTLAQQYAERNEINVPSVSLEVSFVALWQTEEYASIAPLETVQLCDTVHVLFPKLNVEASAKVIRTEWNVLLERYDSIELGDAKSTISSTIQSSFIEPLEKKSTNATNFVSDEMNTMAQLILNGLGLFKTEVKQSNGSVKIYMHNRPVLAESPIQYVIGENGFLVSQNYGRTWSSGIDADGNAVFNSLSANEIKAMNIYGSLIKGSRFESSNGNLDMELWAGVFSQLMNNYFRTCIYSSNGTGSIVLMGGNSTDANVNPSDDFAMRLTKQGISFYKNNATSNIPFFYYWDNGTFGFYRGNSKIEVDVNGNVEINSTGKLNINSSGKLNINSSGDAEINSSGKLNLYSPDGKTTVSCKSLDMYINGVGYDNLGWVNDGNGHAVLGK